MFLQLHTTKLLEDNNVFTKIQKIQNKSSTYLKIGISKLYGNLRKNMKHNFIKFL